MGSPSPSATKLKRESSTTRAGPHRRASSVTSSCVSLESGDQDLLDSPARSTGPGKSQVGTSTSSPRTPAGVNPGEKSVSPAAMKKRRSSIGGTDDLARGLDFSNSSSPINEEKKLHSFLTKGGGHKKVAQPASLIAQASSPGKKTGTTPPGKEKLVSGRATLTSVLSPKKLSDGREISKKDISSPRKPALASEGSSNMNGITPANSELGNNAEQVTATKKSSPLRVSLDGKIGKLSSPRLTTKSKSELGSTKGRTNLNGELAAVDSIVEAETKTDYKISPGVSPDGKIAKKSSPRPSLKSKSSLTSSTGRKLTKNRQDGTPSPPQPGRVMTRNGKAAHNAELSRPEMESVAVPVYSEYEYEREAKSENVVNMSHKMLVPLQHIESDEERSMLLASLMVSGNVGDEDMSSLEQGVEPGFDNDTELPTSWLSEDLPCMFSSLSQLPEHDDSSSSLLGDPPEILDEPFQRYSNENLRAVSNDMNAAEISRSVVVSPPKSPVSTMDGKFVADEDLTDVSNGVHQPAMDESAWNYELNSFCNMVDDPVDKFEAELRTQIDATHELETPQLPVREDEDLADKFEAELRSQIDTTFESPQLSVGQDPVVLAAITKSLLTVDKGESMPYKLTTHREDISSDNESSVSDTVANEAFLQSCPSQVTERSFLEGDKEIFQLDSSSSVKHLSSIPNAKPPLQEEGRWPIVEDKISTSCHTCPDQHLFESSDDEILEDTIEESDSAQLNLEQSFDDVAESLADSRSRVDENNINHANILNVVPVMVSPRVDTSDNALEQYTIGPQELALSTESEFAAEFLDGPDCGAFTPTYLDQNMKVFEEYWTQSVADESSESDAGQNGAKDLQSSTMSEETQLLNAEKSLPPIELPVSVLPVIGKLKLTGEDSIPLEPPVQAHAKVGATKLEILDINEEIPPREGWPCLDSTLSLPTLDNDQVDAESANEEVEEFDEALYLYGGSEESSTSVVMFDNLSSPSRANLLPEDIIQESLDPVVSESFEEASFENAGELDPSVSPGSTTSTLGTEHPHVVDTTQVVLGLQNRDVEGVTEHQNFSLKNSGAQNVSVDGFLHDPHHYSISGTVEGRALQEPIHEDLGTPPISVVSSNDLIGVDIQYLDDDEASGDHLSTIEHLHLGGLDLPIEHPDLSLGTTIRDASHKSSFVTSGMSETHIAVQSNEVFEPGPENPIILQGLEFSASSVQTAGGGGDRNAALSVDYMIDSHNGQSSPDRDISGLIVGVAAESDDSHDLDLKISPKLPKVEGGQTILVSPQVSASAGTATKEVDASESNAQFPPVGEINDEEQTETSFLSCLDQEEESFYGEIHSEGRTDGMTSLDKSQERIGNFVPGLEVQTNFDQEKHQGLNNSEEGAEIMNNYSDCIPTGKLVFNSTEHKENFQDMSSSSREINSEVPRQEFSYIHGDDELQDDERFTTSTLQIFAESHRDVNMSEVDHKPLIMQLTSLQVSETLKDCSDKDENSDYVTTTALDKSLPIGVLDESSTHILSVACVPVSNEEDDTIPDKFDAKSEVNSTASLDIVIPGTEVPISTDSTASSTDILKKDEATHVVAATPFVLLAKELPNTTLNDVNECNRHESECEVDEENSLHGDHSKLGIVNLREQSKVELDWEKSLLTVDSSGSKLGSEEQWDPLHEESLFSNVFHGKVNPCSPTQDSNIADARSDTTEDFVIDQDRSEEASSIISTSASTLSELIEHHDSNLQETQLPLGTLISSDDQVSRTEDAPEVENALMTLSDADFDEDLSEAALDGHAINDMETISGNSSSQGLSLKLFVTPSQDTPNADDDSTKEDPDFSWKVDKEEESLNVILEQNLLPEDVDTVVDNAEKPFILSDQDKTLNVDVDGREEDSSFSGKPERDNVYLRGRREEETLFEEEANVFFSPKNLYGYALGPDTKIAGANDTRNFSSISSTTDKDEDSLNGGVTENSLRDVEDTMVNSPKDSSDATVSGANDLQNDSTASWKADGEIECLNESPEEDTFLKAEDMAVESSKESFNVSGHNTAMLGVDEMDEKSNSSWAACKYEESLDGSLKGDSALEDEKKGVPNLKDRFNVSVQDSPATTISGANCDIQNHTNISWTADNDELESLNGSLEEEPLLEDEDIVVYRPMESLVMSGQDLQGTTLLADDRTEGHLRFSEKADKVGKNLNSIGMEEVVPEVENATPEAEEAMLEVEVAMPEVEATMPVMEEAMPVEEAAMSEAHETVEDNHDEALVVQTNTNAEALMVDVAEKQEIWRDGNEEEENLNGNILEQESVVEVQEMVDHCPTPESNIAPDVLNTNAENLDVDKKEHHLTRTVEEGETLIREQSMFEVEEKEVNIPKESFTISDEDNTNAAISNVDELEKHLTWTTDKEVQSLNRNLEEESVLEVQETLMDCSSGNVMNVLLRQVPEVNGSLKSDSDHMGEDLVCHSTTEDGAMTLHESDKDAVDISTDAVKVENSLVVNADHVDEDSNLGQFIMASAVVDCKSCVIPEMTNGNHLQESDCPHETDAGIETPVLAKETWSSGLESNQQDIDSLEEATEPQSPEATLYPVLASQPPAFSGSKQDRLWEEQAEAYSSGGRGTPSRNEDATQAAAPFHPPSSPGEQPPSSDDQIQPASGPMNNGHTVAGPSNGAGENGGALHEPKGKGKLHTPLRSLLLEDANKSTDGDLSTPNGVTSSPSFIRRLFRVMSTPSRAAERDVSQTKLKKSSSMWVSCLGSPQVKQ